MNMLPAARTLAALALSALLVRAQEPPPEQARRPNWIPATRQFGSCGGAPGAFREPAALAFGAGDVLYVADSGNHRIQKFSIDGSLLGGWGKAGPGDGEFLFPEGVAVSPQGEVYVADTGNHRIQVFDAAGRFLRRWGELRRPRGIAVSKDRVCVTEPDAARVRLFSPKGEVIRAIGDAATFVEPAGAVFDADGVLFVADAGDSRIRVFDATGAPLRDWGAWGAHEGMLAGPSGLALQGGRLYVADGANHRVQVFDRSGNFQFQWGRAPAFAHEGNGRFHFPAGIAVSADGGYTAVCEPVEHRVQLFAKSDARSPRPVSDLPWWDNLHARFHAAPPPGLPAADRRPPRLWAGLETETHSVVFYDTAPKYPSFIARAGGFGRRLGEFLSPAGLLLDPAAPRLLVSDRGNRRLQKMDLVPDPSRPTGFAPAARIIAAWDLASILSPAPEGVLPERCRPGALAGSPSGDTYMVDEGNSVVLVLDPSMKLRRVLRPPKDAPSRFVAVAVDPARGTVYVADRDAFAVLAFDGEGRPLSTWGTRSDKDDQGFLAPAGVAVDGDGSVYVSDSLLHQIRKFDAAGKLLLRWSSQGREPAECWSPQTLSFLPPDRLVVDDAGNHRGQIYSPDGRLVELMHKGGFLPPPPPPK